MSKILYAVPAYGRQYKSTQTIRHDYENGKDFWIYPNGPYFSVRDEAKIKADGYTNLSIQSGDSIVVFDFEVAK